MDCQIELNIRIVPKTDNLIYKNSNSIDYIKFDNESNTLCQFKLKDYSDSSFNCFDFKIVNSYLIVWMLNAQHMELYRIDEVIRTDEIPEPVLLNKEATSFCISSDGKYLIIVSWKNEIFLYSLKQMDTAAYIQSHKDNFCSCISNGKFICLQLSANSSFISYKIDEC